MSSSPPTDTWRGLVEQRVAGTHTALESVKGFTRFAFGFFLAAGFGELPPVALVVGMEAFEEAPPFAGVPPPAGALVPPAPCEAPAPGASWPKVAQTAQAVTSAALRGK
ncbi:MAG: hypothetical protein WAU77_06865 [Solirubrobacteraceae bacterium]